MQKTENLKNTRESHKHHLVQNKLRADLILKFGQNIETLEKIIQIAAIETQFTLRNSYLEKDYSIVFLKKLAEYGIKDDFISLEKKLEVNLNGIDLTDRKMDIFINGYNCIIELKAVSGFNKSYFEQLRLYAQLYKKNYGVDSGGNFLIIFDRKAAKCPDIEDFEESEIGEVQIKKVFRNSQGKFDIYDIL